MQIMQASLAGRGHRPMACRDLPSMGPRSSEGTQALHLFGPRLTACRLCFKDKGIPSRGDAAKVCCQFHESCFVFLIGAFGQEPLFEIL